jgi:uncharacterized protein (TIGR02284 family)
MTEGRELAVDVLNDVLAEDLNAVRAYQEATEHIEEPRLRGLLDELLKERTVFVKELHEEVKRRGGEPVKDETLSGKLKGAWMSLQAAFTDEDTEALMDDLEDAEDTLADTYDEAISRSSEQDVRSLLESHRMRIHESENRIESIRGTLRSG